jgi:hypothetical protein
MLSLRFPKILDFSLYCPLTLLASTLLFLVDKTTQQGGINYAARTKDQSTEWAERFAYSSARDDYPAVTLGAVLNTPKRIRRYRNHH